MYDIVLYVVIMSQLKGVWHTQKASADYKVTTSSVQNEILVKIQAPK